MALTYLSCTCAMFINRPKVLALLGKVEFRRDHYRHRASTERAVDGSSKEFGSIEVPEPELMNEICQCVSALMGTLKPEYAEALRIIDLNEGSLNDLAAGAGITAANAAVRVDWHAIER
jgi:hypothetical protein